MENVAGIEGRKWISACELWNDLVYFSQNPLRYVVDPRNNRQTYASFLENDFE